MNEDDLSPLTADLDPGVNPPEGSWKAQLRAEFESWLDTMPEMPEPLEEEEDYTPDLLAFYEQLAASNAEGRKSNRRTVEAFGQWGETLAGFDRDLQLLRDHFSRAASAADEKSLPISWSLALAEVLDRAQRIRTAFQKPPPSSWLGGTQPWQQAWANQARGLDIMTTHLQELLSKAGLVRIETLGQRFDPITMAAASVEIRPDLPLHTVLEEQSIGYSRDGQVVRVSQVKISTLNSSSL